MRALSVAFGLALLLAVYIVGREVGGQSASFFSIPRASIAMTLPCPCSGSRRCGWFCERRIGGAG
jgi:hypothetical protein